MRWRLLAQLRAFFGGLFQFRGMYLNTLKNCSDFFRVVWTPQTPPRISHWNRFPSLSLQFVLKLKRQWIIWVMILLEHFLTAAIIRPDLELSGRWTEQKRRLTPSRWVAIPEYFLVFLVKLCRVQLSDGNSDLPRHHQPHSPVKNMWTY